MKLVRALLHSLIDCIRRGFPGKGCRFAGWYIPAFATWVESQGVWGPLIFIAGYVLATVSAIPGSILTLAAGAIFGIVPGVAYVFVGAGTGSALAFLIARYLARPAVERRLAANPRFAQIDGAVGREGRKIVFLLPISPVLPFNALNYALGVTKVRFRDYLLGSFGMLPGTLLYVYSGRRVIWRHWPGGGVERGIAYSWFSGSGCSRSSSSRSGSLVSHAAHCRRRPRMAARTMVDPAGVTAAETDCGLLPDDASASPVIRFASSAPSSPPADEHRFLPFPVWPRRASLTNESIFSLMEQPRRLAVIGGGPIGCEIPQAFSRFGTRVDGRAGTPGHHPDRIPVRDPHDGDRRRSGSCSRRCRLGCFTEPQQDGP
ncbi:MAG: VTT domain-containing protein [Gemmatimonadetes bacterium]|nr:VTT domain-containing protein [Gemmatimonadota bacterium]